MPDYIPARDAEFDIVEGRTSDVGQDRRPPPVDPGECTFLALDTRTPYMAEYSGTDRNKTAHYMLRWVSTRGDKGPWSETASATIGA